MNYKKIGIIAVCILSAAVLVGCASNQDNGNRPQGGGRGMHGSGFAGRFGSGQHLGSGQVGSGFRGRLGSGQHLGSGFRGRLGSGQNFSGQNTGIPTN